MISSNTYVSSSDNHKAATLDSDVADYPTVPRILVLMAAYNGSRWIGDQIQSILSQDMVEVRLVVQDDASSDSTRAVVGHIADEDSRVKLTSTEAPSGSAAQNFFSLIRANGAAGFNYVALSD